MKKQNVYNKLAFEKATVAELNEKSLHHVNGGTSSGFTVGTTSTITSTLPFTVSSSDVFINQN